MPIVSGSGGSGGSGGGGTAGTLLAVSQATTGNNQSTTSASLADVDATNAAVTFTAPSSGNVLVIASFIGNMINVAQNGQVGLREATTNIFGPFECVDSSPSAPTTLLITAPMRLSGISAGSHTYKLAFAVTGGATFTIHNIGSSATNYPITMCVYAA